MGRRVGFYINPDRKSLQAMVSDNYSDFRVNALESNSKSIEYYNGRTISLDLEKFLTENPKLKTLQNHPQSIIDELINEFLFVYCDRKSDDLLELIGPLLYTSNYIPSFQFLEKIKDNQLKRIWTFLEKGRSVQNDCFFIPPETEDSLILIGYWKKEEVEYLKKVLREIIERIKKEEESQFFAKIKKKLGFTHVSASYGFELALQALNSLKSNQEIIFDIEY